MLGVYDYTVILTYLSALSASVGIYVSLISTGHPVVGCVCLMACGIFDAFDGKVARTKKNRTEFESKFGIMIDSMTDLIAFGVLPACIGGSILRKPVVYFFNTAMPEGTVKKIVLGVYYVIMALFVVAALIRLSYFNITEEERQKSEGGNRKTFEGLPVTTSALVFPSVLLVEYLVGVSLTPVYFALMCVIGLLFISKLRIPKPGVKQLAVLCLIGVAEIVLFLLKYFVWK